MPQRAQAHLPQLVHRPRVLRLHQGHQIRRRIPQPIQAEARRRRHLPVSRRLLYRQAGRLPTPFPKDNLQRRPRQTLRLHRRRLLLRRRQTSLARRRHRRHPLRLVLPGRRVIPRPLTPLLQDRRPQGSKLHPRPELRLLLRYRRRLLPRHIRLRGITFICIRHVASISTQACRRTNSFTSSGRSVANDPRKL